MRIKSAHKYKIIGIYLFIVALAGVFFCSSTKAEEQKIHLFIFSGQSNMVNLNLNNSFIPIVEERFGERNVLIVKDSENGSSIDQWYKKPVLNWIYIENFIRGKKQETRGELYFRLMKKVQAAIRNKAIASITFIWMQGERDALSKNGENYKSSWEGLMNNLRSDLGRSDINFVIGRLSDFDINNKKYPHWTMIRDIQVSIMAENPDGAWVDTDYFNGANNNLHYSKEGYKLLGKMFAQKSITLITKKKKKKKKKKNK